MGRGRVSAAGRVDHRTSPDRYRHWRLTVEGRVARLALAVDPGAALAPGYELKRNSYDLGVDIELHDAVQRLRFEHPQVGAVVVASGLPGVFCAGANIGMLARASHAEKVNFCKFTNETRNAIEEASARSGLRFLAAIDGACAGGGYELALACDRILLADDGASAVSLPEVPLLAVLPGTGGLTRLVDKRKVRRDLADVFCTAAEGMRGARALAWGLVDELAPRSRFAEAAAARAAELAALSDRPAGAQGVALPPLARETARGRIRYPHIAVDIDRERSAAEITISAPAAPPPADMAAAEAQGAAFWPLALARELDDAVLELRANEAEIGLWIFRSRGESAHVAAADRLLLDNAGHWFARETTLFLARALKRVENSARSVFTLAEPGSCFAGTLLELVLAADRSFMLDGAFAGSNAPPPALVATGMNFGPLARAGGLSRLAHRFSGDAAAAARVEARIGEPLAAAEAESLGLVTFAPDDIDWEDEVRLAIEERASFSPDALTGMEASLRFGGPETLETKIFGRLSAWQNWIFQRPNAVGDRGALTLYGAGRRPAYTRERT